MAILRYMTTHDGLTTGRAAKYIGLHPVTLQRLDREGKLSASRTKGGRRVFLRESLDEYIGRTAAIIPKKNYAYCRVSSKAQQPDLKNQRAILEEFCLARGLANVEYIEEIGGGLNFKRPKFLELVSELVERKVGILVIAHKDRLARFGFDLLEFLCRTHGCELLVLNTERVSPEQEMVQDLMAITHCFSSRLYGLRNYRKSLKEALK